MRGISSFAHGKDYSLCMTTGENEEEQFHEVVKMVQGKRVDGIILLYSQSNDKIIDYLFKMKFPFVVIGRPSKNIEEITYVDNDNYQAARELTEYLIAAGHERIAFLGGGENLLSTQDRLSGFCDMMERAGLKISERWIKHGDCEKEASKEIVEEIMSSDYTPTAILAANDILALGVLSALGEKGVNVPKDMAVVSFNNSMISELANPPLTTVDVNIHQLGYESARCMIGKIEGEVAETTSIIVPTKIIRRQTCQQRDESAW